MRVGCVGRTAEGGGCTRVGRNFGSGVAGATQNDRLGSVREGSNMRALAATAATAASWAVRPRRRW
eukprot:808967-Pleurochrysis_carterae.AAC.1